MKAIVKRVIMLVLTCVLLISCAACAAPSTQSEASAIAAEAPSEAAQETDSGEAAQEAAAEETPQAEEQTDAKWIDSDITGSVTADTETNAAEDFHVFVNKDWLSQNQISESASQATSFTQREEEVKDEIMGLIGDASQTSHEAVLVKDLYEGFTNMEVRDELGMEPVMPYIEDIQRIKTIDDLTAYLKDGDALADPLYSISVIADLKDSSKNSVYLGATSFTLSDADEYKSITAYGERRKEVLTAAMEKLLVKAGYTQDEADGIIGQMFSIEEKIASATMGSSAQKQAGFNESIYNPKTLQELEELSPVFPIAALLQDYTDAGADRFILTDEGWLDKMNELYTQENVEAFKAKLLCETLKTAILYLDSECMEIDNEAEESITGTEIAINVENNAYDQCNSLLNMAVGKMYAENYATAEIKADLDDMISEATEVYKQRLEQNDWLSAETKEKAIEKLDSMRVRSVCPDDWSKYSYDDLNYASVEDGGTLIDMVVSIWNFKYEQQLKNVNKSIDHEEWSVITPQQVNAFYFRLDNSINIPIGILGGDFYDPNASREENMGTIGMVIGHEITHAFDTGGSQFDKDGNLNNWWTDTDSAEFKKRTDKVAEYYGGMEVLPGEYVDGELTVTETVADLGGVSCMLEIAKNTEDFDYDAFFTSYARLWKAQNSKEVEESLLRDSHAPAYLRTNVTVQQFQEFYDTYDVKEGDKMYLSPEERLAVW